jgi:hypothetical protein
MADELALLEEEARLVLGHTKSLFHQCPHHFPYTSYGFVMCLFSKIDLFSRYWFPAARNQTSRMATFLNQHVGYGINESDVAVRLWRHCLMHTSQPRLLLDPTNSVSYGWLLQHELFTHHCVFQNTGNPRILNLGVLNLASDLRNAAKTLIYDLPNRSDVLSKWEGISAKATTMRR